MTEEERKELAELSSRIDDLSESEFLRMTHLRKLRNADAELRKKEMEKEAERLRKEAEKEAEKVKREEERKRRKQETKQENKMEKDMSKQEKFRLLHERANQIINKLNLKLNFARVLVGKDEHNFDINMRLDEELRATWVDTLGTLTEEDVEKVLKTKLSEELGPRFSEVRSNLKFNPDLKDYSSKILKDIVVHMRDPNSISSEEDDINAFKQWMSQVKRKVLGTSVKFHIALYIFGLKQGSGKTELVKQLCKPLEHLSDTTFRLSDLSKDNLEKNIKIVAGNYINSFDELSKNATDDVIAAFKRVVTDETIGYRPFHTQSRNVLVNNSSVIATSNFPSGDVFVNENNRRIYQFTTIKDLPARCKTIHDYHAEFPVFSIDFLKVWQGIDENVESYFDEEATIRLNNYRAAWSYSSMFSDFIKDSELFVECGTEAIPAYLIYRDETAATLKPKLIEEKFKYYMLSYSRMLDCFSAYKKKYGLNEKINPSISKVIETFKDRDLYLEGHALKDLRRSKLHMLVHTSHYNNFLVNYMDIPSSLLKKKTENSVNKALLDAL